MSVGKPKIPTPVTPAASPPAASKETASLQTGGTDESDLQASIKNQRKGRSALRIEEGRAGKSAEASTLNTQSDFTIGKIDAMPDTNTAPAKSALQTRMETMAANGQDIFKNPFGLTAKKSTTPAVTNDKSTGGRNTGTGGPSANTSYSANDKKGNPKAGGTASKGRDKSR
jgi:hypothetical protein